MKKKISWNNIKPETQKEQPIIQLQLEWML